MRAVSTVCATTGDAASVAPMAIAADETRQLRCFFIGTSSRGFCAGHCNVDPAASERLSIRSPRSVPDLASSSFVANASRQSARPALPGPFAGDVGGVADQAGKAALAAPTAASSWLLEARGHCARTSSVAGFWTIAHLALLLLERALGAPLYRTVYHGPTPRAEQKAGWTRPVGSIYYDGGIW